MKYFKPERLVELQERGNKRRFVAALDAWENSAAAYQDHFDHIKSSLPAGLRRLLSSVALHDAEVIDISRGKGLRFTIILQPQAEPARQVVLRYALAEPARIIENVLPQELQSQPLAWLYDELDVGKPSINGNGKGTAGGRSHAHRILLSNGWEVRLKFCGVTVSRAESLLPRVSGDALVRS